MTVIGDHVRVVRHDEDGPLVHRIMWINIRDRPDRDRARMVQMTCGAVANTHLTDAYATADPLSCVWCIAGTRRFP